LSQAPPHSVVILLLIFILLLLLLILPLPSMGGEREGRREGGKAI
jgi:hypothetical protein